MLQHINEHNVPAVPSQVNYITNKSKYYMADLMEYKNLIDEFLIEKDNFLEHINKKNKEALVKLCDFLIQYLVINEYKPMNDQIEIMLSKFFEVLNIEYSKKYNKSNIINEILSDQEFWKLIDAIKEYLHTGLSIYFEREILISALCEYKYLGKQTLLFFKYEEVEHNPDSELYSHFPSKKYPFANDVHNR